MSRLQKNRPTHWSDWSFPLCPLPVVEQCRGLHRLWSFAASILILAVLGLVLRLVYEVLFEIGWSQFLDFFLKRIV